MWSAEVLTTYFCIDCRSATKLCQQVCHAGPRGNFPDITSRILNAQPTMKHDAQTCVGPVIRLYSMHSPRLLNRRGNPCQRFVIHPGRLLVAIASGCSADCIESAYLTNCDQVDASPNRCTASSYGTGTRPVTRKLPTVSDLLSNIPNSTHYLA